MDGFLKYLNHHMSKFTFVFICVLIFNSAVNAKEYSSVKEISISQKILGVLTERKFLMHLPKNFDFEDVYPVIFFLHGKGGKMEQFPRILQKFVNTHRFIGIYPQGYLNSWNLGKEPSKANDIYFIASIVENLEKVQKIKSVNYFAVGFSNGGGLVNKLVLETNIFNSVAVLVSQLTEELLNNSKTVNKTSVLQINGLKDKIVPFRGGKTKMGHKFFSALKSIEHWAKLSNCEKYQTQFDTAFGNKIYEFPNCQKSQNIMLLEVKKSGHFIPPNTEGNLFKFILNFFSL